jgi:hypothetical protein
VDFLHPTNTRRILKPPKSSLKKRLIEKGLNPVEVSTITGHKDTKMLMRYTHLRAEDLVGRLGYYCRYIVSSFLTSAHACGKMPVITIS